MVGSGPVMPIVPTGRTLVLQIDLFLATGFH
jgi:hypothetical protein